MFKVGSDALLKKDLIYNSHVFPIQGQVVCLFHVASKPNQTFFLFLLHNTQNISDRDILKEKYF